VALVTGTRVGPYEVIAMLGAGGMGEVYRANDTVLKRQVALKVLAPEVADDPERVARFQREAEVLASLNHPNIAHLYGLEGCGGTLALVMELVEGPTLADRIAKGALPIDEALPIARQIAEALEAAHERGIIHRDLKPANIKVRDDGTVKVLDFGLAKAMEPNKRVAMSSSAQLTNSPTITSPALATGVGVLLGTAAYMSPEQAKGRPADKRSDVWAFGCVLFEMLTGLRPLEGGDVSDTLATVLKIEPDWNAVPSSAPPSIRALLQGCLRKDHHDRIHDMSTALFLLEQRHAPGADGSIREQPSRPVWKQALLIVASVLIGAAAATATLWKPRASSLPVVTRFVIRLPQGQQLALPRQAIAISPDGSRLVYGAGDRLFLRSMGEVAPREIPGTESAINPVFSPDGQSLAFWSSGSLKRIAVTGGTAVSIYSTNPAPGGMVWDKSGIFFAEARTGILRVSPDGGKPDMLVPLSNQDALLYGPQLLPDGDTLLFTTTSLAGGAGDPWDRGRINMQSIKRGERQTLIDLGTDGRYVPTGHIVYVLNGTLFAVPFDLARRVVTGGPVPIVEGVRRLPGFSVGGANFAFSNTGSLAYQAGVAATGQPALVVIDQKGQAEPLKVARGLYAYPRVSPDGQRLAFEGNDGKQTYIAIYDLSGASAVRRLTLDGNNRFPIWSADGRRVAFQSNREGDLAVFWQSADGGPAERLTRPDPGTSHTPEAWSPRADAFLFNVTKGSEQSLWTFDMRERKATSFGNVRSTTFPSDAVFSPDGRWVAYQTGEPGQGEGTLFVRPYPADATIFQVARGGRPLWSHDGTTLFYIPSPGQLMSVTVRTQPTFSFTSPVAVPRGFGIADPAYPRPFDIMSDGRIIGLGVPGQTQADAEESAQIHVVLNWFEELKAKVPAK
jgi:serine/threonine-protein kinase